VILGFKKQFIDKILDGTKIHTIRTDKHDRWAAGRKIHFGTGVRHWSYKQFHEAECISVQKIEIKWLEVETTTTESTKKTIHRQAAVFVNGFYMDIYTIAKNDGFDSVEDFHKWFDKDFTGKLIHWTDYKY